VENYHGVNHKRNDNMIYHDVYKPWLVDGVFENFNTYDYIFKDKNTNVNKGNDTTTNNGIQKDINLNLYPLLVKDLTRKINELFTTNKLPFTVDKVDVGWWIKYNKGGFQSLHRHVRDEPEKYEVEKIQKNKGLCSVVVCFSNSVGERDIGNFYGLCGEDYFQFKSLSGNIWIFESTVWHGVYPTMNERKIMAFDVFYNINKE
jgi:hypothetical protein